MQKLGQHFLKNPAILRNIVDALDFQKGDTIVEVGPGHGELTMPLVRAAQDHDGKVISIEKDHALIAPLTALGDSEKPGFLTIIEGDALKILPKTVDGLRYKLAGNIPYYITGKLLRILSELEDKPDVAVLLVQNEVAERICATAPAMNRLAAIVQFWAAPKIVAFVPKHDFSPPPKVDSAVIILSTKKPAARAGDATRYYKTAHSVFAQPRKTLLNNLSAAAKTPIGKKAVVEHLQKIGIDPDSRPQNLTIGQIAALAKTEIWG